MLYVVQDGVSANIPIGVLITMVIVSTLITVGFYVLRSIGLYKMAENRGVEKRWMAYIPLVWIFTACKIIGDCKFFGTKVKGFAIIVFVLYTIVQVYSVVEGFLTTFPLIGFFLDGGEIFYFLSDATVYDPMKIYPLMDGICTNGPIELVVNGKYVDFVYNVKVLNALNIVGSIIGIVSLASLLFLVNLYMQLFIKYVPTRYVVLTLLSLFGGFGIIVFVIRNRQPVNLAQYYRAYQNPYGAPPNNPYGTPPNNNPYGAPPQSNPFGPEFDSEEDKAKRANKPENPFSEFSDDDKKDDN